MSDDVRRRLEDAGSSPVAGPDAAFADALEARLRAVGASLPPHQPLPPRRRWSGFGRRAAGAVVVAAVVVALGVTVVGPRLVPAQAQTLVHPVNVAVVLTDGTILEDPDGLVLPEGAVITVYPGGSARIGDTDLSPGDVATVRDGRLDVDRAPVAVVATPSGGQVAPTPSMRTDAPPARTPTPAPTASPGRSPAPTPFPTRNPAVTDSAATPAPTATPAPAILRPRLRARLISGPRIAVTWTETLRARRYVLVVTRSRSGPAGDPVYPGSRVLGEFATPPESPLRYRVPDGVIEVRLMVVALRADGSVLRRSNIVTVTVTASADTTGSVPDASASPTPSPAQESAPPPTVPSEPEGTPLPTTTPGP